MCQVYDVILCMALGLHVWIQVCMRVCLRASTDRSQTVRFMDVSNYQPINVTALVPFYGLVSPYEYRCRHTYMCTCVSTSP